MKMKRNASAQWNGGLKDGKGTISTDSGVLRDTQYSFSTRFEDGKDAEIWPSHTGAHSWMPMAYSQDPTDLSSMVNTRLRGKAFIRAPIPGPDGKPARLVSVSRDITDARRLESALADREQAWHGDSDHRQMSLIPEICSG